MTFGTMMTLTSVDRHKIYKTSVHSCLKLWEIKLIKPCDFGSIRFFILYFFNHIIMGISVTAVPLQ